jgi:hypothetical protein
MSQNHQDPPDIPVQRLVPYDEQDDIECRSQSLDTPAPPVDNMIKIIKANKPSAASHLKKPLTGQNWPDWSIRMIRMLRTFQVWPYITGKITRPTVNLHLESTENWDTNNEWAKLLIVQNINEEQLQHVNQDLMMSKQLWESLSGLHHGAGYWTAITYMRTVFQLQAADDENIPAFYNKYKKLVEKVNSMQDNIFHITEQLKPAPGTA